MHLDSPGRENRSRLLRLREKERRRPKRFPQTLASGEAKPRSRQLALENPYEMARRSIRRATSCSHHRPFAAKAACTTIPPGLCEVRPHHSSIPSHIPSSTRRRTSNYALLSRCNPSREKEEMASPKREPLRFGVITGMENLGRGESSF
jgi:hypothetical protein